MAYASIRKCPSGYTFSSSLAASLLLCCSGVLMCATSRGGPPARQGMSEGESTQSALLDIATLYVSDTSVQRARITDVHVRYLPSGSGTRLRNRIRSEAVRLFCEVNGYSRKPCQGLFFKWSSLFVMNNLHLYERICAPALHHSSPSKKVALRMSRMPELHAHALLCRTSAS